MVNTLVSSTADFHKCNKEKKNCQIELNKACSLLRITYFFGVTFTVEISDHNRIIFYSKNGSGRWYCVNLY